MTFVARETSIWGGAPVELYQFTMDGTVFRFTSADTVINDGTNNWYPDLIQRNEAKQEKSVEQQSLSIDCHQEFVIARAFIGPAPKASVSLIIYRLHRQDIEKQAVWQGSVRGAEFITDNAVLYCETVQAAASKAGLVRVWGHGCQHFLYDSLCGLNAESFGTNGIITGISSDGITLTVTNASLGSDYLTAGFIRRTNTNEMRLITNHSSGGNSFSILSPFNSLALNEPVRFYKGCRRDTDSCKTFPNNANASLVNIENYGGFPNTPTENVFITGLR